MLPALGIPWPPAARCGDVLVWPGQMIRPRPIDALTNNAKPRPSAAAMRSGDVCRREPLPAAGNSVETGIGGGACTESLVTSAHWLPSHQRKSPAAPAGSGYQPGLAAAVTPRA